MRSTVVVAERADSVLELAYARAWFDGRIGRGRKEMFAEVVPVTPAMAKIMLTVNGVNRPLRPEGVERWATAIRDGKWIKMHQGISFSSCGVLNNGQHRLTAIVETGITVDMMVTFGESRSAVAVIDLPKVRTPSDVLTIAGETNTTNMAATARIILQVERNRLTKAGVKTITHQDLLAWLEKNRTAAYAALLIGDRSQALIGGGRAGVAAAAYMIGRAETGLPVGQFFDRLIVGVGLAERSPILLARNWIIRKEYQHHAVRHGMHGAMIICGTVCKAWNRWRRGEQFDHVAAWPNRDVAFPRPI